MTSKPIDKDKLYMMPRSEAVDAALEVISALQRRTPEQIVAGLGLAFACVAHRSLLDPQEVHRIGAAILEDRLYEGRDNMRLQSLRDFAGIRIRGERNVSIA
jgi:hypothetical protein